MFPFCALLVAAACFSLAAGEHQSPRTFRAPRPFHGLSELNQYQTNPLNDRNFYHRVENNGFLLEYNVTIQEGVFNWTQTRMFSTLCDALDPTSLQVFAIDPKAVLTRIRESKYLIGGLNWGCMHGIYNKTDANYQADAELPIYRFIKETTYSNGTETIHVKSHVIPMSHVLEKSSITLIIHPNYKPLTIDDDSYYEETGSYAFNHDYNDATGEP